MASFQHNLLFSMACNWANPEPALNDSYAQGTPSGQNLWQNASATVFRGPDSASLRERIADMLSCDMTPSSSSPAEAW